MSNSIDVSCPECKKAIKATAELQGKKVRCKGCGHIFVIPAAEPAKPPMVKVEAKKTDDDDGPSSYTVAKEEEKGTPRCPHCAMEMESETARICLHCGYDTLARQQLRTKKVYDITPGERIAWLMPGFLALVFIFVLIGFDLFFCLAFPNIIDEHSDWALLDHTGVRLWTVIISVLMMLGLAKFAWNRLIMNPVPPEQTKG